MVVNIVDAVDVAPCYHVILVLGNCPERLDPRAGSIKLFLLFGLQYPEVRPLTTNPIPLWVINSKCHLNSLHPRLSLSHSSHSGSIPGKVMRVTAVAVNNISFCQIHAPLVILRIGPQRCNLNRIRQELFRAALRIIEIGNSEDTLILYLFEESPRPTCLPYG